MMGDCNIPADGLTNDAVATVLPHVACAAASSHDGKVAADNEQAKAEAIAPCSTKFLSRTQTWADASEDPSLPSAVFEATAVETAASFLKARAVLEQAVAFAAAAGSATDSASSSSVLGSSKASAGIAAGSDEPRASMVSSSCHSSVPG